MKSIILLLLAISLSGCYVRPAQVPSTMDLSNNEGMIVGTLSFENEFMASESNVFFYANDSIADLLSKKQYDAILKQNSSKYKYSIYRPGHRGNFTEEGKEIYYFSIVKPAGKYRFYASEIFRNSGYMQSTIVLPIDIPFEIEKGKVKYLGELNLNEKKGEIKLLDKRERDKARFNERYPTIPFN